MWRFKEFCPWRAGLFVVVTLVAGKPSGGWGQAALDPFPEQSYIPGLGALELVDQFDQPHSVTFPADRPLVLAIYQKFSKKQLPGWLDPISAEFGDRVRILRVADLSDFPPKMRDLLRKVFLHDGRPASVMDFSGEFGRLVPEAKLDQMGLLVIGKEGEILFRETGEATEEKLRSASHWIDADLGKTTPPMASAPLPAPASIPPSMPPSAPPPPANPTPLSVPPSPAAPPLETSPAAAMSPSATSPVPAPEMSPAPALEPSAPAETPRTLPTVDVDALSRVKMIDQFDQQHSLSFPEERPVLITANGRRGQEQIKQWLDPLKEEFGDQVRLISVADIRGLPGFLRGSMKEKFRTDLPQPVIMDFSGDVVRLLPSDPANVTLTVLDRSGKVIFAASGSPSQAQLQSLTEVLRQETGTSPF